MTLTFYHVPNSSSLVTSNVLAELNHGRTTPLETRIELSLEKGDTHTPSFLSTINPNGRVPAIVHHGIPIWESAAITMYLGETFGVKSEGNNSLYPAPSPQRGEAMKWIVWANVAIVEAGRRLYSTMMPGNLTPEEKASIKERALGDLKRMLGVLDEVFRDREFLLEQGYTLADTHVWSFLRWLMFMQVDLSQHKNVVEWMQRVGQRPALMEEVKEHKD